MAREKRKPVTEMRTHMINDSAVEAHFNWQQLRRRRCSCAREQSAAAALFAAAPAGRPARANSGATQPKVGRRPPPQTRRRAAADKFARPPRVGHCARAIVVASPP